MTAPSIKPYIRLLRAQDLALIKDVHRELFQFDIVATDDTLYEAVTSSRWLCLASVQAGVSAQQEEQLAGFAMSAMGKAQDFNDGGYFTGPAPSAMADIPGPASSEPAAVARSTKQNMPESLKALKLMPEDTVVNVVLLGVLPSYRRMGIASSLLSQIINSARTARAKAIVLHVLETNSPARTFYQQLGFIEAMTVANYYTVPAASADQPAQHRDAILMYLPLTGPEAAQVTSARSAARAGRSSSAAASTSSTATPSSTAPPRRQAPPPPKMRGLMGPASTSRTRTQSVVSTTKPPASSTGTPTQPQKSAGAVDQQHPERKGGMFGGLFGMLQRAQSGQDGRQRSAAQTGEGEQQGLLVTEGEDGEVYVSDGEAAAGPIASSSSSPGSRDVHTAAVQGRQTMLAGGRGLGLVYPHSNVPFPVSGRHHALHRTDVRATTAVHRFTCQYRVMQRHAVRPPGSVAIRARLI